MQKATSIPEVIAALDSIVNWCRQHNNRTGYFAVLYRNMTVGVQQGLVQNVLKTAHAWKSWM